VLDHISFQWPIGTDYTNSRNMLGTMDLKILYMVLCFIGGVLFECYGCD